VIAFKKNKKDIFKDGSGGGLVRFLVRKKKQDVKNGSLLQREDVIYGMGGLIRT
jgi:hypothetical protein